MKILLNSKDKVLARLTQEYMAGRLSISDYHIQHSAVKESADGYDQYYYSRIVRSAKSY